MKRKSKAASIKGTPPITKFFKRSPDIKSKAKPLTAILTLPDISSSKSTAVVKCSESKAKPKVVEEVINKNTTKFSVRNKAALETNTLNGENVDDLILFAENFTSKKFHASEFVAHSPKGKSREKTKEKYSELNHFAAEKFLPGKNCLFVEKEKKGGFLVSEKKIQNGFFRRSGNSQLSSSEWKTLSTERLESEGRICDGEDQKQCCSNSEKEFNMQYFPVKPGEFLSKDDFPCKTVENVVSPGKNFVSKRRAGATQELLDRNSLNTKTVNASLTTSDIDICTDQIGNSEKRFRKKIKSNPLLNNSDLREETTESLFDDNSSSNKFDTNKIKDITRCAMEVSMGDEYRTAQSDQLDQETKNYSESKTDITGCSGIIEEDGEDICRDDSLDGSDLEIENVNDKKIANLNTENSGSDPRIDSMEETQEPHEGHEYGVGDISDNEDESSDDELLHPVSFLRDNRVKPEVRTPEKSLTPIMGSPLITPISPFIAKEKKVPRRLKYSLDTLLSQKPKQAEKEKAFAVLQLAMQEFIETGKNAGIAEDIGTDMSDDDEALLPIHQKELEKIKSTDKGFSERKDGLDLFPWLKQPIIYANGCSQPFPAVKSAHLNEMTKSLYQLSDVKVRELICSGLIADRYPRQPWPPSFIQWLYHILCYHTDSHTISATYSTLWSKLHVGDSEEKHIKLSWIPCVQDVLNVFIHYGANLTIPYSRQDLFKMACEMDAFFQTKKEQESSFFPLDNFTHLIQFLALCVARHPQSYSAKDIEHLVLVLCGISLDIRMQICQQDIKKCLQALYSAVEPNHWSEEATKISSIIHGTASHHRDKLHIIKLQPYSSRGRDVKRLAALQLMASLLNNPITDAKVFVQSDLDEKKDKEILSTMEAFKKLAMLLQEVSLNDDTDYYQLYTIIELLDITVGAENLLPSDKPIVEKITKKLRSLHSDIKDPRAMFISRTKVKDLVLRTISKFCYMTQGKKVSQSQTAITKFFVEGKTDLHIETLKDSEFEEEDEEDATSQASFGSKSQMTEYSDDESLLESQELP